MSELGISSYTTTGRKIDDLTRALENLEIEDDAKRIIEGHLRELKKDAIKPPKIKDLVVFDPAKQKLRSWLTAADNFVYNQRIEGEENKVRAIGSYLRELAWDWFEPILNEANNKPKSECEDRTCRIMGSYKEFKKSLGKVFGQLDERKIAAEKLARLRQTTSVTLYITEFQTITSNLDWDEEALTDKFLEGLKQEVRQALIYYPNEPKDLDDLFERTQRIDNELKKNRETNHFHKRPFAGTGRSSYARGPAVRKDGEGDVIMKGAKVDMEKAKRERLCFHCEKPGHQAKFCRARKREAGKNGHTIRMLRTGMSEMSISDLLGNLNDEDLTSELSEDLKTSDDDDKPDELEEPTHDKNISEDLEKRIQDWRHTSRSYRAVDYRRGNERRTRGGRTPQLKKATPRFTGVWPKEHESRPEALAGNAAQGTKPTRAYPTTTTEIENCLQEEEELHSHGDVKGLGTLGSYDFGKLIETNDNPWKERLGYFDEKHINRIREANWERENCDCYTFRVCWAFTKDSWTSHIEKCINCEVWEERDCRVPGHDQVTKRLLLNDLSMRRHVTEPKLEDNKRKGDCCTKGLCTHEFITHANHKIPWWACFSDSCEEHLAQKINSEQLPQIPFVTIENAQKCPCLRRGCICNYNNNHPFQNALLSPPSSVMITEALRDTIKRLEDFKKKGEIHQRIIRQEVYNIRQTSTRVGG
jgi:hypothetical protein